ncbi:hypothetical protein [Cystobacter fuscus]|uniref:hypothetical protein n=1 Tax=Cystobacter fuscus TaxID=43 RepID=UPI002B31D557|nr:hypothetical protein F0U63_32255 [Cystobacter fuscus]
MNSIEIRSLLQADPDVFIHYTDETGLRNILQEGVIRPNRKGHVYFTQEPFSQADAHMNLFLAQSTHEGRGSHILVIRLDPGVRITKMSDLYEFRIQDSLKLHQHEVLYEGKNPFGL